MRRQAMSGGQKSRVNLGIALLGEPELLLLDEPTVGLDPVLRTQLWDTFTLLAGRGKTLIVSSHVMEEATRCDRLLLMREGSLLRHVTPAQLLRDTGTPDLDAAFLETIRRAESAT